MANNIKPPQSSWFTNVAKSLGYLGKERLESAMPGLTDTIGSAKEVIGEAKETIQTMKESKGRKKFDALLKINTDDYLGKAIRMRDNLIEDIKSGNINNTSRKSDSEMFGDDDFNFDDFDMDFDDGGFDVDGDEESDVVVPDITINSNINKNNPMVKAVEYESEMIGNIAAETAKRDVVLSEAQMKLSTELASKLSGNMGTINDNIGLMVDFNNNIMSKFTSAATSYYESSLSTMNAMLEELKKTTSPHKKDDYSSITPFSVSDIFSYGGGFDIGAYIEKVKKNIKSEASSSFLGSAASMLGSINILDEFVANPIGTALSFVVDIPEAAKNLLEKFDQSLGAFIPSMISKFNDMAENFEGGGFANGLIRTVSKVLGFGLDKKSYVDLSRYEKGPVPFDGVVRKSIVEVIPTYLSKILASVSGDEPIAFDYEKGAFINALQAKDDFYKNIKRDILYEYDKVYELREAAKDAFPNDPEKQKQFIDKLETGLVKLSEKKGVIDPRNVTDYDKGLLSIFNNTTSNINPLIRGNSLTEEELNAAVSIFNDDTILNPTDRMRMFAGADRMNAGEQYSNALRRIETDTSGKATMIFGGAYEDLNRKTDEQGNRTIRTTDAERLEEVKQLLREGKTEIPSEFSDVVLDLEAKTMLRQNQRKREKEGRKLFKDDKNPINKFLNKVLDKPIEFLSDKVDKIEQRFHDIIFGKGDPNDPEEKEPWVKRLKNGIDSWYHKIKDSLFGDEGFFTKIKESDFYKSMVSKKDQFMEFLFGVKDSATGSFTGGLFSDTANIFKGYGDTVTSYFKGEGGVFDKAKEQFATVKDTVRTSFNEAFYGTPERPEDAEPVTVTSVVDTAASSLKLGFQNFSNLIFGPKFKADGTSNESYIDVDDLMGKVKERAPKALADGIIGAGAGLFLSATSSGLLSGLVLGPIGGAVVGIAGSFLARSQTFQNLMFGYDDADTGERIEGFISDKTQQWFKDNKSTLISGGAIGGIAGLMGAGALPAFILGGPISGAILGVASAFVIKSDAFQKFLFGDEDKQGVINRIKTGLSNKFGDSTIDVKTTMGTIGAGGVGGLGLFGLLGASPVLGAFLGIGAGLMATSEKWSAKIFGTVDESTGERRKDGLLSKATDSVVKSVINPIALMGKTALTYTMNWFDKDFKEPIIHTMEYAFEGIKGAGVKLLEFVSNTASGTFIKKFLFDPIIGLVKGSLNLMGKMVKGLVLGAGKAMLNMISTPLKLAGFGVRTVSSMFIDADTRDELRTRHRDRVRENRAKRDQRNAELRQFKSQLSNTNILDRYTSGETDSERRSSRRSLMGALKAKYGKGFSKLSDIEQAEIMTNEAQADDIAKIRDLEDNQAKTVVEIKDILLRIANGDDAPLVNPNTGDIVSSETDTNNTTNDDTDTPSVYIPNGGGNSSSIFDGLNLDAGHAAQLALGLATDSTGTILDEMGNSDNKSLANASSILGLLTDPAGTIGDMLGDSDNSLANAASKGIQAITDPAGLIADTLESVKDADDDSPLGAIKNFFAATEDDSEGDLALLDKVASLVRLTSDPIGFLSDTLGEKLGGDSDDESDTPTADIVDDDNKSDDVQDAIMQETSDVAEIKDILLSVVSGDNTITIADVNSDNNASNDINDALEMTSPSVVEYNPETDESDRIGEVQLSTVGQVFRDDGGEALGDGGNAISRMMAKHKENDESGGTIRDLLVTFTKGPIGTLVGMLTKVISPFAAKVGLIGIAAIGVISLFTNPLKFFEGVIKGIGTIIKTIFAPVIEWARGQMTEGMDDIENEDYRAVNALTAGEAIQNDILPQISQNDNSSNAELLQSLLASYDEMNNIRAAEGTVDSMASKAAYNTSIYAAQGITQFDAETRASLGLGDNSPVYREIVARSASGTQEITGRDEFMQGLTNPVATWGTEGTGATSSATADLYTSLNIEESNAVGESNVSENSVRLLHKDEGVLTASANHLFGGAETTAGVLNAYARNGAMNDDATAISSILSGTLNKPTQITPSPVNVNGLMDAMFGGIDDLSSLEKYIKQVRNDSLTASDNEYWAFDESKGGKYGGLAKAMFYITRFANYPARLIDSTLNDVSTDMEDVKTTVDGGDTGNSTTSTGGKIKNAVTSVFGKIKDWFGGIGGSDTEDTQPRGSTGGSISIGSSPNDYYKFPSFSTPISDINMNRIFSDGSSGGKHRGLDITTNNANREILSTTNGEIIALGDGGTFGNQVYVQDERGMVHSYSHLDSISNIKVGDKIRQGALLGIEGTTGASDGVHLHYEVGSGFNGLGVHADGLVHPAEYIEGYNRGDKNILATPVEDYKVGSYWDGTSNPSTTAGSTSTISTSSSSTTSGTLLDKLYAPFMEFNNALKGEIKGKSVSSTSTSTSVASGLELEGGAMDEQIWRALKGVGYTDAAAAGIMGNLKLESNLQTTNLENSKESKLGFTDETYTKAVDNGTYSGDDFTYDKAGYGLAQWTYYTRKKALYDLAKSMNKSISDPEVQVQHLKNELVGYGNLDALARKSNSVSEMTERVLWDFENPDPTVAHADERHSAAKSYYNTFKGIGGGDPITDKFTTINNKVSPSTLSAVANTEIVKQLRVAITYLSQIAGNTKSTISELSEIKKNQKSKKEDTPKTEQVSRGSATNSEMYDIVNQRRATERSNRNYNIAKSIARGY